MAFLDRQKPRARRVDLPGPDLREKLIEWTSPRHLRRLFVLGFFFTGLMLLVHLPFEPLGHALGEPWTLEMMAASCHLGVTQFVHHFRQATNLTPAHYLAKARVNRASQLLISDPQRPITDIAFDCGFSSSQYFTNVFTRQAGCSPRQFRSKQMAD